MVGKKQKTKLAKAITSSKHACPLCAKQLVPHQDLLHCSSCDMTALESDIKKIQSLNKKLNAAKIGSSLKKKVGKSIRDIKKEIVSSKTKTTKKKLSFDIKSIKAQIEREMGHKRRSTSSNISPERKKHIQNNYVQTFVPGLDDLFENGVPKGNAVIVAGGAGSGKTIMCLQTLYNNALQGKKVLYMTFEESEERLKRHMLSFGFDDKKAWKNIKIQRFSPFDISRSVEALLMKAKGELLIDVEPIIFPKNFKPDIIALDSLTAIASAFTGKDDSYRIYIEQLFRFFEKSGATSFLITETQQVPKVFSQTGVEEFLADGVIVLYAIRNGNVRENAIEILKMRGEKHEKKIVALQITSEGMTVYPEQEVFAGIE